MSECLICETTENVDEHHTSYDPEKTVLLCRSCHQRVHNADSHPLQPDDRPDKTSVQITDEQKELLDGLKKADNEPYRSVVARLLDAYDSDDADVTEARAREIAEGVVADRVVPEAQR